MVTAKEMVWTIVCCRWIMIDGDNMVAKRYSVLGTEGVKKRAIAAVKVEGEKNMDKDTQACRQNAER